MHQFLRLMFNPVAGRMVRTLFLERLRAERELAPPAGAAVERIVSGPIGAAQGAWSEALARTRLPMANDPGLPADVLELIGTDGARARIALGTVAPPDRKAGPLPLAVLSPAGPYGRVVESVGADDAAHGLVAAPRAACAPGLAYPGTGERAPRLHGQTLAGQAAIALESAAAEHAGDPAFLDTAAIHGGCGVPPRGTLTWAWSERDSLRGRLGPTGERAWARLEPALARDFA
jgi:3-hydroxyacyl-CoA dehydrogenase/enoyl-CoA hydratase/3-hydroxybutyryl-CoA epimerase